MLPKPYYENELGRLYHADCLDILPHLEPVDLVLTDPPYGIGDIWNGGAGGKSSWKIKAVETKKWDMKTQENAVNLSIDKSTKAIVWGGNYYNLPISRCWLIWDKKMSDNFTTGQAEMAWTNLDKPIRVFRFAQCEAYGNMNKQHPSQKPLSLMTWCLKWHDGTVVLDPFLGSGTTAVACERLKRRWIGIEIEEKYCAISVKRIESERKQLKLF
jgi:site-specific DNA-methyltransferase (adenine-specific)